MNIAVLIMSAAAGAAAGWFVSWLVGRATQVSSPIEAAVTTIGSAAAVAALSWKFKTPGLLLLVYGTLVLVLIGVTVFDIRKHTIPHIVTIPGMITGLILGSFVLPLGVGRSVTGFLVGGGVLMAATIVEALRKKEIGGGDWKYAAMIGSFIGPQSIVVALVFTGILGIVGGIVLAVAGVHGRPQALGPWLSAGAVASILFTRLS